MLCFAFAAKVAARHQLVTEKPKRGRGGSGLPTSPARDQEAPPHGGYVGFEKPSLDLLRRAVALANMNPQFAVRFVEEAALLANSHGALRDVLDGCLSKKRGPRIEWTMSEKRLLVDMYDRYKRHFTAEKSYDELNRDWPPHQTSYWRKRISEFRSEIKKLDPYAFKK